MSSDPYKHINRYNGSKLVKHVALSTENRRSSGAPSIQKLRQHILNNSHDQYNLKTKRDSERGLQKQFTTMNLQEQRISLSPKKKLKKVGLRIDSQHFKLPNIQNKSSQKKKFQEEENHVKSMRSEYSSLLLQIEDHLKPKPVSKYQKTKKKKEFFSVFRTKAGLNAMNIKINQDIEIIDQKLPHQLKLFCICDGHGANGHHVAAFIKKKLIQNLRRDLKQIQKQFLQQQIFLVFQKTNAELLQSHINTDLSGSTVVAIFIHENRIFSFNVGDSRAILINYHQNLWNSLPLSNDHKPQKQSEAKRIKLHGGRIAAQTNEKGEEVGPLRVWLKDIRSPGLAMTRSFGDKMGIKAGTTGDPEVLQFILKNKNKYLVVASDGIWQHFQNYEIVKLLSPYLKQDKIEEAANTLMQKCCQKWAENYTSRDDITFILVKLNELNIHDQEY